MRCLNRIFRVYGRHWWANNRAQSYVQDEHYDRLLPVHLQSRAGRSSENADHVPNGRRDGRYVGGGIEIGQIVQLNGFSVTKVGDGATR